MGFAIIGPLSQTEKQVQTGSLSAMQNIYKGQVAGSLSSQLSA